MTPRSRRNRPDRSSSDLVKRVSAQGPGRSFGTQRRIRRLIRSIGGAVIALPLALLLLIGVRFASMPITQAAALSAYESGAYDQVGPRLTAVQTANLFETYLPHLTEGTAKLQAGDAAGAEKDLRRALDEWEKGKDINSPPYSECIIRNNLAIAIVEGAPAETGDARGAKMNEAQEILQPCLPGGASEDNNENQEQTSGTGEAIEQEKQKNSGQDPGDEENPGGGQDRVTRRTRAGARTRVTRRTPAAMARTIRRSRARRKARPPARSPAVSRSARSGSWRSATIPQRTPAAHRTMME